MVKNHSGAACVCLFFELFSDFLKAKTRKREKTRENGSSPAVIKKNAKKRLTSMAASRIISEHVSQALFGLHF